MEQYDSNDNRAKVAAGLGGGGGLRGLERPRRQPKSYVLEMLPYPSGTLHVGHMLVYTIGDVVTRFRARNGMQVLHPQGFDAFGLPAENAAIKEGVHPRVTTDRNIEHIRRLMRRVGWAYAWRRSLATHQPDYIRWQQWQFLRFYEKGLAYRKAAHVKWCPNDQTVLANEQVRDGHCERCGAEVESRLMEQWFFRITDYAQALLDDLDTVDWPESIKARQRNWIGPLRGRRDPLPDRGAGRGRPRLHDASRHALRRDLLRPRARARARGSYRVGRGARLRPPRVREEDRGARGGDREDRRLHGLHAVNPVNGERLPVYVADYVLTDYGTGRDHGRARARPARLRLRDGVRPADAAGRAAPDGDVDESAAYVEHTEGEVLVNSAEFDGLPAPEGGRQDRRASSPPTAAAGFAINYRLRDWGFSRQRYWGCPIPVVYCEACGIVPLPEDELPVLLPEIEDYKPKGQPPLAQAEDWVNVSCPRCDGAAPREIETMDTFVDSSWYFLRYCDPDNDRRAVRAGGRRLLESDRPLHRRRRSRDRAHDLRPLLDEGAERSRAHRLPGAVRALLLERLGDAGQDEDVEARRQRRRPGRVRRALRSRRLPPEHPVPRPGERGHGVDGVERRGYGALRRDGCGAW